MKTSNRITRLVDDLAAHWTEPAFETLNAVGKVGSSVQSEIDVWRVLSTALQSELQEQREFRSASAASLKAIRERVFERAISVLTVKHNPLTTSRQFDQRVSDLIRDRQSTAAERELFGELVIAAEPRNTYKSPRQTDFVPRFQLAAVGG
jgi:hypothetical protein